MHITTLRAKQNKVGKKETAHGFEPITLKFIINSTLSVLIGPHVIFSDIIIVIILILIY